MEQTRSTLRLVSALILLAFVISHLCGHSLLLISRSFAETGLAALMRPWRSDAGTTLLLTAVLVHYANALWSIYRRRSLKLKAWEWSQLGLGLCIPVLLALHVASTRIAEVSAGVDTSYSYILVLHWVIVPALALLQAATVVALWLHACIGIHFWLRTKVWYPHWRVWLGAFALLLPTLALCGYLSAGAQIIREAKADPEFAGKVLEDSAVSDETLGSIERVGALIIAVHLGLVALAFGGRSARRWLLSSRRLPLLVHACGRRVPVMAGASVLEALRDHGVPHASVCGGRARCTTCRIQVTRGLEALAAPHSLEASALARIAAKPGIRLACQVRPTQDLHITPLLAADAGAADGFIRGGLEGSEQLVTVMFVDLRGSTTLGEAKLPYDVLFLLNRFFHEMNQAIIGSRGHYSQFTGDGLMALYGLDASSLQNGPADALRGAADMLVRLERLNGELKDELSQPLRIGIGIHYSEAIVGLMGPPRSMIITAIGDTVNTAARLEGLTKDYDCPIIISRRAAEVAGLDLREHTLHEAPVKGRTQVVQFLALRDVPALRS